MIVDDVAAHSSFVRTFCSSAQIFRVPMPIYPWDDLVGGQPGLLWSGDDSLDPKSPGGSLDCSWARPPFDRFVLFSEVKEPGIQLVRLQGVLASQEKMKDAADLARREWGEDSWEYTLATQVQLILNTWLIGFTNRRPMGPLLVRYTDAVYRRDGQVTLFMPHEHVLRSAAADRISLESEKVFRAMETKIIIQTYWMGIVNGKERDSHEWFTRAERIVRHKIGGVPGYLRMGGLTMREEIESDDLDKHNMITNVVAACALLNCKNIVHEPVIPSAELQSQRKRRQQRPCYSYHQLRIRAKGRLRSLRSDSPARMEATAVHWRRGHFKAYTAEHPLFGNRIGLWWWQPHLAGRGHDRFADKQYAL